MPGMFPNALPEAADYTPKTPGEQPKDLGLSVRKLNRFDSSDGPALKGCAYGPNCFSTTGDPDDPLISTLLPGWKAPPGATPAGAVAELEALVRAYPPGQGNVDGGGFQVVKAEPGYLYAQFASLKRGYVDDLEFAVAPSGAVQVRAGGRTAQKADKGSNAKRLNYLSAQLREKGWEAPEITKDTHTFYFRMNSAKPKTQCVGLNCPEELSLDPE